MITIDTRRDNGSAGLGVMTVGVVAVTDGAAGDVVGSAAIAATGAAAADGVADANDGCSAGTTRIASRRRAVVSMVGALTARGFGLIFTDMSPDSSRGVPRRLRRASVSGASDVAGVVAASIDDRESVVVLMFWLSDLFTAPRGSTRRGW
ncbi:MAG TPA: hypothetical protein VHJ79_09845 [Mycobacterium sp.]|nr:hypothetical protein [Mycobacterium sp.]